MNTTLNDEFIFAAAGDASVQQLLNLRNVQTFYVTYLMPWIGSITCLTNMVVAVLCAIIYSKTKKKNHKPAFVFIGVLSFFDMLIGRYFLKNIIWFLHTNLLKWKYIKKNVFLILTYFYIKDIIFITTLTLIYTLKMKIR